MAAESPAQRLNLGRWTADRMTGRLAGPGGVRAVEPKVMDLLFILGSEPGRVRSRAELLQALWPGVVVGDDVIARSVFKLRAALRDGPDPADMLDLEGKPAEAAEMMARAYDSMNLVYAREPARIRPWLAEVGLNIVRRRLALGDQAGALRWYARTLQDHPQATADQALRLELAHAALATSLR